MAKMYQRFDQEDRAGQQYTQIMDDSLTCGEHEKMLVSGKP